MSVDAYYRKRRLAYATVAATALLLGLGWTFGQLPEPNRGGALVAADGELLLLHDVLVGAEAQPEQIVVALDADTFAPRVRLRLFGQVTAVAPSRDGPVAFYGRQWAPLEQEGPLAARALDQGWEVQAAAAGEGAVWIAGHDAVASELKTRRLDDGRGGPEETIARLDAPIEQLCLTWSAGGAPTASWTVAGDSRIRVARRLDGAWRSWETFEPDRASRWTVFQHGRREILVTSHRADNQFFRVRLRVRCCTACGLPPLPEMWEFDDPILLSRSLTGLAATVRGDRVLLALVRFSSIQMVSLPSSTMSPDSESRLRPMRVGAAVPRVLLVLWVSLLLFLSFALVYLGLSLIRERRLALLAATGVARFIRPSTADVSQRIMAYFIDWIVLLPVYATGLEILNLMPAGPEVAIDVTTLLAAAFFAAVYLPYFILCEWRWGRTLGKRILGIRVVRRDGTPATLADVIVRNATRLLDATGAPQVVAVFLMLVTSRRQRLGDLLAGTIVRPVEAADHPPGSQPLQRLLEEAVRRARRRKEQPPPEA